MLINEEEYKHMQRIINTMRELWSGYAQWMRMLIISSISDLSDICFVMQRLIKNAADTTNEMNKYLDKEKSKKFEELLISHLLTGKALIDNAKSDNVQAVDESRREWYENADELAEFLYDINSYYNEHEWRAMIYDHIFMTEKEAYYRLKGEFEAEILEYDNIASQILRIADMISEGIIKQANYN